MEQIISEIRKLNLDDTMTIKKSVELILSTLRKDSKIPIPIPIVKISQGMGFQVYQQVIEDNKLSGYIAISGDLKENLPSDRIISVSKSESLGHKRFTIAHELAHFLFDFDPTKMAEYYDTYHTDKVHSSQREEQRANTFAACLLMPEEEFKKEFNTLISDNSLYDATSILADRFQVSVTAVQRRLTELELVVG